ncbi:hypothetical protein OAT16_09710 [Prolixibacteraceae bacterium]|nr:hypothetical protein [Prolixibacteraceae bacterium]
MKAIINMNPHQSKYKVVGALITVISVVITLLDFNSSNTLINIALFSTTVLGILLYTNLFSLNTCNIIFQPKSIVIKWKGKFRPEWIHINFMKSWGIKHDILYINTNSGVKEYSIKFLSNKRKELLKEALTQYSKHIDKEFHLE